MYLWYWFSTMKRAFTSPMHIPRCSYESPYCLYWKPRHLNFYIGAAWVFLHSCLCAYSYVSCQVCVSSSWGQFCSPVSLATSSQSGVKMCLWRQKECKRWQRCSSTSATVTICPSKAGRRQIHWLQHPPLTRGVCQQPGPPREIDCILLNAHE